MGEEAQKLTVHPERLAGLRSIVPYKLWNSRDTTSIGDFVFYNFCNNKKKNANCNNKEFEDTPVSLAKKPVN